MRLTYTIEFYSYWHCGSGLSAGGDTDALVIKDNNGLPFLPGKTLKGLLRDSCTTLLELKGDSSQAAISRIFGMPAGNPAGSAFFSNATINHREYDTILNKKLAKYLYTGLAFTKIEDGIAKDMSLRRMEVTVPCRLHGSIDGVSETDYELLAQGLKMIKRIGTDRNRGLGRCNIIIEKEA